MSFDEYIAEHGNMMDKDEDDTLLNRHGGKLALAAGGLAAAGAVYYKGDKILEYIRQGKPEKVAEELDGSLDKSDFGKIWNWLNMDYKFWNKAKEKSEEALRETVGESVKNITEDITEELNKELTEESSQIITKSILPSLNVESIKKIVDRMSYKPKFSYLNNLGNMKKEFLFNFIRSLDKIRVINESKDKLKKIASL